MQGAAIEDPGNQNVTIRQIEKMFGGPRLTRTFMEGLITRERQWQKLNENTNESTNENVEHLHDQKKLVSMYRTEKIPIVSPSTANNDLLQGMGDGLWSILNDQIR